MNLCRDTVESFSSKTAYTRLQAIPHDRTNSAILPRFLLLNNHSRSDPCPVFSVYQQSPVLFSIDHNDQGYKSDVPLLDAIPLRKRFRGQLITRKVWGKGFENSQQLKPKFDKA